ARWRSPRSGRGTSPRSRRWAGPASARRGPGSSSPTSASTPPSTAGEEARNPRRDLPMAIVVSLVVVTAVYVLVALAAVGAMHWTKFGISGSEASLAQLLGEA